MSDLIRMSGWVRKLTDNGTVYYVHRSTGESRWDHPGLSAALESLCNFDNIRYAAYRLSSKLIYLTESLGCTNVPLETLLRVTVHHGIVAPSIILDSQYIREILQDIYNWSTQQHRHSLPGGNLNAGSTVFSEAMANFIEQVLDPAHQGSVTSLGLKTVMTVFCRARLREKLVYLFREHSHKGMLGHTELTFLLSIISRIPELLGEGVMFGSHAVTKAVQTALKMGGGRGLTEEAWLYWVGHDPPELVWLTTSYRLMSGAGIKHNLSCSVCAEPIVGLRYQCLQCLGYDLCQSCFFTGSTSRNHRPKHPVQEYCFPSTRSDQMKAMFATIINKFKPRSILKQRKKVTRRLTVDRFDGVQLRQQFRSSLRDHRQISKGSKTSSTSSVPVYDTSSTNSVPLPRRRINTDFFPPKQNGGGSADLRNGFGSATSTLTRSDQLRRPVRKTSRSSNSPRDDDYEGVNVQTVQGSMPATAENFDEALYHRISPTSSGFCSGSESHSSDVRSSDEFKTSTKLQEKPLRKMREKPERKFSSTKLKTKSPLSENPGTLKSTKSGKDDIAVVSGGKSRESIIDLEWDDNGIQLDTDVFADELWMNPGHVFQNSILRQDLDTGEVLVFKEGKNTTETLDLNHSKLSNNKMSLQKSLTASRAEIFSILGHLEHDEKRLTAKLSRSPDLVQPITEAQEQLNRLKEMMFNIFGPRQPLPENQEIDRQLNMSDILFSQERLQITEENEGNNNHDKSSNSNFHLANISKLPGSIQHSLNLTSCQKLDNQVESTHLEPHFSSYQTPKNIKTSECLFSPIVFDTDPGHEENDDFSDFSLTRYQLSDLSTRLGGTKLSYSKDTLHDISEKLKASTAKDDSTEEQLEASGSCYKEAVDDLEHLMKSLSNLFCDFSSDGNDTTAFNPDGSVSLEEKYRGITGEPGRVLKIVAQLNQLIGTTKESNI